MNQTAQRLCIACLLAVFACSAAQAQLRGHGGPVRTLAISPDGKTAISGSFDTSAIRWSLTQNTAEQVLRFHDSAVNAVAILKDGRYVTAGEDGRIAIWRAGIQKPDIVLEGHTAPIVSVAVSPRWQDARFGVMGSHHAALVARRKNARACCEGHQDNVNGVAFAPDGKALVSAGYDATVRIWPLAGEGAPIIVTLPATLNCRRGRAGRRASSPAVRTARFTSCRRTGSCRANSTPARRRSLRSPRAAMARWSPPPAFAARSRSSTARIATLMRTLVGPGLPVWSVAFFPDNKTLLTGGTDRMVRRWDATTGEHIGSVALADAEDPLARYNGDRGAELYRACVACHTLSPDEGNRAGPTLSGIFGRKIATLPGYKFSEALTKLNIVWTPETVSKLFEIGPAKYTPGTKMPEQRITSPDDRAALMTFLEKATKKAGK